MKEWKPNFAGGTIYYCLEQCLKDLNCSPDNAFLCTINDVSIIVYKNSNLSDLCDKFDLTRKLQYGKKL